MNMQQTVNHLTDRILSRQVTQVITANPIMVMSALESPEYMAMMKRAELVVPDGTGVVWAAKHVGNPVAERVPGFELLHHLLRVGESQGWKVYLLGSSPEIVRETYDRLRAQFPKVSFVGYRDGFFGASEDAEVIRAIRETNPDLLFVARGADTQEPWIARYKQELNVPLIMGVGGSFDVISGKTKRAPAAFQKLHLEWFYRLLKEPTRYKRMLALPKFAVKVLRDKENVQKG
ncbi:WecB/TagA/CpsF family glycosyltransferase [Paenibacillus swuensis]